MTTNQAMEYAHQCGDLTVESLEFWCTAIAYDPNPPENNSEAHPLKEYLIKFSVMNGKKPLIIGYKTFVESTGLDYAKGKYVSHPSTEEVKAELAKIADNPILLDKTLVLKTAFLVTWRILFTFSVQVLSGNYSSTEQVNSIQQLFAYCLLTGTKVDIGEIIYNDLVTRLTNKSRQKYVSNIRFVYCALEVLLGPEYTMDKSFGSSPTIPSNSIFSKDPSKVTPIELTTFMIDGPEASGPLPQNRKKPKSKKPPAETQRETYNLLTSTGNNTNPLILGLPSKFLITVGLKPDVTEGHLGTKIKGYQVDEPIYLDGWVPFPDRSHSPLNKDKHEPSPAQDTQESDSDFSSPDLKKYNNILPLTERQLALNGVTKTLKVIQDAVKDDPALTKKVIKASDAYTKNSTALTKLLILVKNFDFQGLKSSVESLQAIALRQDEYLSSWAKTSTSMAWNLGPRMIIVKSSQAEIRFEISSLKSDTLEIKSMMTEIYQAFKGQSSTPLSSVPQTTLAITKGPSNVKVGGENVTHVDSKEPPSHTKGEHVAKEDDTEKTESDKAEEEPTNAIPITTVKPTKTSTLEA
ncbi:hypothetical protein Tco_0367547 [Tanacetum coccineum]